ncbi:expressed protein [Richelia intracellularis HH01]|uniref:Expressed protein n=1 Tax=Richelia intracellularis HH01 TaxID=1165094 RepID=M1X0H7_9NOST|nr:expressed protein [Richelia intracellularis HH01]
MLKAFVAGATGQTGRLIVQELRRRNIPVRALLRNIKKTKTTWPDGVELVEADLLNYKSLSTALGDSTIILCASGARPNFNPTGPYKVDYEGTKNLVDMAKVGGIKHFVLVSSLCVSQLFHPLNLFWLVLLWKKQAEKYIQKSGLNYTIIRPGGLKDKDNTGNIVMQSADTLFEGTISRQKVADICVEAMFDESAKNKVLEIVSNCNTPRKELSELFANVI